MKIDFVFLYVNGHDPKHIEKKNKYLKEENKIYNPVHRYEDIEEIKYSVNSILKNLNWVNKIYIVTDNQIPPVNPKLIETSKVIIIDHKQIIPKKYLPTFYSDVIESYVHNIPGLNEIFLYGNDDYFCLSKMEKSDFIINDKLIIYSIKYPLNKIFCNSFLNEYTKRIYITAKLLLNKNIINDEQFINSHQIKIFRKNTLKKMDNVFINELDDLRKNKFRNRTSINYNFLAMNYEQYLNNNILINLNYNNSLFIANKKLLQILFFLLKKKIINRRFLKKNFVCLNCIDISFKDEFIVLMKLLKLD